MKKLDFLKSKTSLFVIGILVGGLIMAAIRVVTYSPEHTHYHANFAVFINGKQEGFKAPKYYEEEISTCVASHQITQPMDRAHMHDNENSVVHVHDHAATWGQFFNNLGWNVSANVVETDTGKIYTADGTNKVHLMIDGQDYTDLSSVSNMKIKDQSKVLISFGDMSEDQIQAEYKTIKNEAKEHDMSKDPASCASREAIPFKERFKHIF